MLFLDLPIELQLQIASHLDPPSLIRLSKTCKALGALSVDSQLWKQSYEYVRRRGRVGMPLNPGLSRKDKKWERSCQNEESMDYCREFRLITSNYTLSDCSLSSGIVWNLVNVPESNLLLSSSSTGQMHLLENAEELRLKSSIQFDHKVANAYGLGEPCRVDLLKSHVAVACWNNSMYKCDFNNTGQVSVIGNVDSATTALKVLNENLVALGTAGPRAKTMVFDLRCPENAIYSYKLEGSVLCVASDGQGRIYSGGRFKSLTSFDLKAGKLAAVQFCPSQIYSMSYSNGKLYTGRGRVRGSGGCIDHWYIDQLQLVQSIDSPQAVNFLHTNGQRGIWGSIYGGVMMMNATFDENICSLVRNPHGSYTDGILVGDSILLSHFGGVCRLSPSPDFDYILEPEFEEMWSQGSGPFVKPYSPVSQHHIFRREEPPPQPSWINSFLRWCGL